MNTEATISLERIRGYFPSLDRLYNGQPLIYMDGPGGTQIPRKVVEAMEEYYWNSNSNTHGFFPTTMETDQVIDEARKSVADFLGAEGPNTISFGQNMTTLNYSLSKAIGRLLKPGDEILITQLDHEANRGPWLALQNDNPSVNIREVKMHLNGTLDYDDFSSKLNERTRLIAVGVASNALGTINDIRRIREESRKYGSWLLLDAVHYAPHFSIDVTQFDCEFLLCSAYKFYGPHVGILYCKPGLLEGLPTDCLRTQDQKAPYKIETGTLNHAALAGVSAAIDFIASIGDGNSRRLQLINAMNSLSSYENSLGVKLFNGLSAIDGVEVIGPDFNSEMRAPTVSITVEGHRPEALCQYLGDQGICAWDGHFYAIRAIEALGLMEKGGVVRFGVSAYTSEEEIEVVTEKIRAYASS